MAEQTQGTYTHTAGEEHPDNKPPITIVAPVSDEKKKEIEDAVNAEIQASRPPGSEQQKVAQQAAPKVEENLEDHTVAELKAIAEEKGVTIPWDANKHDIIKAIKKAK